MVDPDFSVKPSILRTNVVFELIGTWLGLRLGGLGTKVLGQGGLTMKINIEISIYSAFISKRTEEWGCYKLIFYYFGGSQRLLWVPKTGRKLHLGKKSTPTV